MLGVGVGVSVGKGTDVLVGCGGVLVTGNTVDVNSTVFELQATSAKNTGMEKCKKNENIFFILTPFLFSFKFFM